VHACKLPARISLSSGIDDRNDQYYSGFKFSQLEMSKSCSDMLTYQY
jgi:hypothetical protein